MIWLGIVIGIMGTLVAEVVFVIGSVFYSEYKYKKGDWEDPFTENK